MENNRNTREYRLAEKILRLEEALEQANTNAKKNGLLGVLPQNTSPTFGGSMAYHARVRKILRDYIV